MEIIFTEAFGEILWFLFLLADALWLGFGSLVVMDEFGYCRSLKWKIHFWLYLTNFVGTIIVGIIFILIESGAIIVVW